MTPGLPVLLSKMCLNVILTYALLVTEIVYAHFLFTFYMSVQYQAYPACLTAE